MGRVRRSSLLCMPVDVWLNTLICNNIHGPAVSNAGPQ